VSSSGSDKPRVPPPPLLRKPSPPPVALPKPAARKQAAEVDFDLDVDDTPSPEQQPAVSRTAPGFPSRPRDATRASSDEAASGHAATLLAMPSEGATLLASPRDEAKPTGDAKPSLDIVPAGADAPTFTPPAETTPRIDGHAEDVDMSTRELDVLFGDQAPHALAEGEAEAEEAAAAEQAPPKLKHALPRPKPSKSKASEFATSTRRPTPPPMSGNVPRGIRPPSSRPVKPEDTQVIIAALGAAMIDEEPAAGDSMNAPAAPAAATSSVQRVSPPTAILDDEDFEPRAKQPPWLWIAVGAIAAVVIAFVALSWGDDDGAAQAPEQSPAYSGAAMSAENDKEQQPVVKARREAPTPAAATPPTEEKAAPAELAVADVEEIEEVEEIAEVEDAAPADIDAPAVAEAAATPEPTPAPIASAQHNKRNKHRSRHQPPPRTVSSAAPPPASAPASKASSSTKGEPGADELLAQAKRALSSGSNSVAYTLAAKSRRLKKSNDALQIMAKAGCRLGSENKAKAAFAQLPFGMKAGIRSECRAKGIRLGL
jgi:hypothetical protein